MNDTPSISEESGSEPKRYWGYRPVLKKGKPYKIGDLEGIGDDYLVLEEVHYENDVPVARDGGRAFKVDATEGAEGMIELLQTAIRHIRERGVLEDPWPDKPVTAAERECLEETSLEMRLLKKSVGSCSCGVKSHELEHHDPLCLYRLLSESINVVTEKKDNS